MSGPDSDGVKLEKPIQYSIWGIEWLVSYCEQFMELLPCCRLQRGEKKEKTVYVCHYILTGCKVALGQGRYRWRHEKVLRKIGEHVQLHCEIRANAT